MENDEEKIVNILKNIDIKITNDGKCFLDGKDVSEAIRQMNVTKRASKISPIVALREVMRDKQRKMAASNNIVMEGRDITTEVFPNADFKFYLDASVEERTNRRYKQNLEKGMEISKEEIRKSIEDRDYDDMNRPVGALTRTDDQHYIDTSNMSIDEVVNEMLEVINK